MRKQEFIRLIRLFAGLTAYSVGITMCVQANIGLSPWDVFHHGLALRTGLTFGVASAVASAAIVAAAALCREQFGVGAILNIFYIALIIDLLILGGIILKAPGLFSGILMMICGLFIIALAMVLYIGAGYGAGPRDSLMVILSKRTGKPAGLCRSVVEAIALVCGWLLGGQIGIGTVIAVFGAGITAQIVFRLLNFDVKSQRHESVGETLARVRAALRG